MEHCIAKLIKRLSLKNVVQTYAVANRIDHHELRSACVEFADRKENRCADNHNLCASSALHLALIVPSATKLRLPRYHWRRHALCSSWGCAATCVAHVTMNFCTGKLSDEVEIQPRC